ncbi:MAG: alpha/beta hydrolase [Pseudomonadales bacterium]
MRGTGQDLVFLHGLGADLRQAMAATHSLQGCRVLCIDMPGHGDSVSSDQSLFSFNAFADAVVALLDELDIDSAVWGGISMGSGIALNAALRYPNRVDALLLVRPAWLDTPAFPQLGIISEIGEWITAKGVEEARDRLVETTVYKRALQLSQLCADSIAGLLTRSQATAAAGVLQAMVRDQPFETMDDLVRLDIPVLVFGNKNDPLHPKELAIRLSSGLSRPRYIDLPARYLEPEKHAALMLESTQEFVNALAITTNT